MNSSYLPDGVFSKMIGMDTKELLVRDSTCMLTSPFNLLILCFLHIENKNDSSFHSSFEKSFYFFFAFKGCLVNAY